MRTYFTSTFVLLGFLLTEPALAASHHIGSLHRVERAAGSGLVYAPQSQ